MIEHYATRAHSKFVLLNFPQLVIATMLTRELVRWERHSYGYEMLTMTTAWCVLRIGKIAIVIAMTETVVTAATDCRAFGNVHRLACEFRRPRFKESRKLPAFLYGLDLSNLLYFKCAKVNTI